MNQPTLYRIKTNYGCAIHLRQLTSDKTLCGKPQENYDNEEGTHTIESFLKIYSYTRAACKKCLKIAIDNQKLINTQ